MRPFLALAVVLFALPASAGGPKTEGPKPGDAAPAFTLTDQDGKPHQLKDFLGKVVVLEWTNPECPFVVRHYRKDTMETLAKKYAGKDVVWLAINSSHFANNAFNKKWAEAEKLPFKVLDDHTGATGHAYGARTTPDMYVIDPAGKIAYRGAIDDDPYGDKANPKNFVDTALMQHFAGKPVASARTKPYGCSVKYASN